MPQSLQYDVVVIGAGAAGLFAATAAACRNRKTLLLEKNHRPGVKILMSGGTRCNITQAGNATDVAAAFGRRQGQFLRTAFNGLPPDAVVQKVHDLGVPTKVEPGGKVFPQSNQASDVLNALLKMLKKAGAELALDEPVANITYAGEQFQIHSNGKVITANSVIVTVGGKSYPGSGTTGDGYAWAEAFGHKIVPTHAALTPITTRDSWVPDLSGITVEDVDLLVQSTNEPSPYAGKQKRFERPPTRRGSMLLTHFGLSGPAALDVSRAISQHGQPQSLTVCCNWLPEKDASQVEFEIQQEAAQAGGKTISTLVSQWLPKRLTDQLLELAAIPADLKLAELRREQRADLLKTLHEFKFRIQGVRGYKKAEVTMGGVELNEIDSRTMQSKLMPGLFFAGEILDIDGPIGGYNFQSAFSTGQLAGENA